MRASAARLGNFSRILASRRVLNAAVLAANAHLKQTIAFLATRHSLRKAQVAVSIGLSAAAKSTKTRHPVHAGITQHLFSTTVHATRHDTPGDRIKMGRWPIGVLQT